MTEGIAERDAETIAAFLDGRLSSGERRALLERLDGDAALYEVFVETVRCREALGAEPPLAPVAAASNRLPARLWGSVPRGAWAWAAAAMLLVALFAALSYSLLWQGELSTRRLASSLAAGGRISSQLGPAWFEVGWSELRGRPRDPAALQTAFRLGVRTLQMEVALRAGKTEDAGIVAQRLQPLIENLEESESLQLQYARLRTQLEAQASLDGALELAADAEGEVEARQDGLVAAYALGRWAEAGRLGAGSGQIRLLRSRAFRRMGARLSGHQWPEPVTARLEGVVRLLGEGGAEELGALELAFGALVAAL